MKEEDGSECEIWDRVCVRSAWVFDGKQGGNKKKKKLFSSFFFFALWQISSGSASEWAMGSRFIRREPQGVAWRRESIATLFFRVQSTSDAPRAISWIYAPVLSRLFSSPSLLESHIYIRRTIRIYRSLSLSNKKKKKKQFLLLNRSFSSFFFFFFFIPSLPQYLLNRRAILLADSKGWRQWHHPPQDTKEIHTRVGTASACVRAWGFEYKKKRGTRTRWAMDRWGQFSYCNVKL